VFDEVGTGITFWKYLLLTLKYRIPYIFQSTSRYDIQNNILFKRMLSSGMLRRVALVKTDVSEEHSASIIKVTRIGELGTTLAVTGNIRNTEYFFAVFFGR
jgi:hypothetical protein